jgi:eukaryotic-like serine/threonine-protein kinase
MTGSEPGDVPGTRGAPGERDRSRLTPEQWRRLEPLLDVVLDTPSERRPALIAELSGGDAAWGAEIMRFAAECERVHPLLDTPAAAHFAAALLAERPPMPDVLADRYRVLREAGQGGMAIVYVARDLKHGREVAVKVVRPSLAAAIGRERFLREIEIAARLRHPHIVPLYDSGEVSTSEAMDGTLLYYVMPYEAGRSLRERLEEEGALGVGDALSILRDLCEALSHAHQHGIVHRDIKPENLLLSGRHALVSDFGVARAMTAAAEPEMADAVGTLLASTALGTPAYMAPEQAIAGARVDHRVDLYAVGVVGYEMLAGAPPLVAGVPPRSSAQRDEVMNALRRQRLDAPAALLDAIARCLATRPEDRWQSADDLLAVLGSVPESSGKTTASAAPRRIMRVALLGAAVVAVALTTFTLARRRSRAGDVPLDFGRARQLTSERGLEVQPSISPDGRFVAYAAGNSQRMRIAVRPVAGGAARWLTAGAVSAWSPRWSPDGARILFLSRGGVFSVPGSGGPEREEIASRPNVIVRAATWSADGRAIAYVRGDSLLARITGTRQSRLVVTGPDLHSCRWSPDGAWIACVSGNSFNVTLDAVSGVGPMFGNLAPSRIVLVPASGGALVNLTDSVTLNQSPVWSRSAHTLYFVSNRNGPRDVYALDVRAHAASNAVRVTTGLGAQSIDLPVSDERMVYSAYSSSANVWAMPIPAHPPATTSSAIPVTSGTQTIEGVRASPDGRWLVFDSDLSGKSDVYRMPLTGGDVERMTHGASDDFRGSLSPNGRELAYHSFTSGARNIMLLTLGDGPPRQLTRSRGRQFAMANWSPDGTALSFFDLRNGLVLVMRRDRRGAWNAPRVVARNAWRPEWSPDGRTLAYVSPDEGRIGLVPADSGAPRVLYLPGTGDPLAELAVFSASGRELYFKSHDSLGRASFWSINASGGRPRRLVRFDDPAWSSNRFDFASDGKRLYFTVEDRQSDVWVAEIAKP